MSVILCDESMPYSGHREIYQHVRFVFAQQQCRQWCMRSHRNERKTFFFSFSFSIYRLVKGVVWPLLRRTTRNIECQNSMLTSSNTYFCGRDQSSTRNDIRKSKDLRRLPLLDNKWIKIKVGQWTYQWRSTYGNLPYVIVVALTFPICSTSIRIIIFMNHDY